MFRRIASKIVGVQLGSNFTRDIRALCTVKTTEPANTSPVNEVKTPTDNKVGGFARAFEKFTHIQEDEAPKETQSFATLLRNSKLMDLGYPEGKTVIGKIFHIVGEDLYIDFGWKFHCVCSRPTNRSDEYVRGARVRLLVRSLELSSKFIGSNTELTLLEADCKLLGLISSPVNSSKTSDGVQV